MSDGTVGRLAVQKVSKTAFETVVSGLMMPNGHGRETVKGSTDRTFSTCNLIYLNELSNPVNLRKKYWQAPEQPYYLFL